MGRFEYALVAAMALLISGTLGLILQSPDAVMEESRVDLGRTGVPGGLTFAAPDDVPAPRMAPIATDDAMPEPDGEPRFVELGATDSLIIGEGGPAPAEAADETDGMEEAAMSDGMDTGSEEMAVTIEASDTVELEDGGSEGTVDAEFDGRTTAIEVSDTVELEDGGSEGTVDAESDDRTTAIEASDAVSVDDG